MKRQIIKQYAAFIWVALLCGVSGAAAMDVKTYYDVDIKSMQISIDGSKRVLSCLKNGCPTQEQYALDDTIQKELKALFDAVNSSPSKHAGFYMKHRKEVEAYYENNTTLQERYRELKATLESVNKEIKTIREEQRQ